MSDFENLYKQLNENQKKAVDTTEGAVIVNAGPGCGKTQILSLRAANILRQSDAGAHNILCLTYTDAAAKNMRQRLTKIIGQDALRLTICTFHSFAVEIINRYPEHFFNGAAFKPVDNFAQHQIMEQIFSSLPYDHPLSSYHPNLGFSYLSSALELIKGLKKEGLTPDEFEYVLGLNTRYQEPVNRVLQSHLPPRLTSKFLNLLPEFVQTLQEIPNPYDNLKQDTNLGREYIFYHFNYGQKLITDLELVMQKCMDTNSTKPFGSWRDFNLDKNKQGLTVLKDTTRHDKFLALADIYRQYQQKMLEKGWYDFEDMLIETIRVLENEQFKYIRMGLQERYQYILVDEFQDTNGVQMRLLDCIIDSKQNEGDPNVMVVGDPDQAIFKFQGASSSNLTEFVARYPRVKTVNLIHNYRSRQEILDFAAHVINSCQNRLGNRDKLVAAAFSHT